MQYPSEALSAYALQLAVASHWALQVSRVMPLNCEKIRSEPTHLVSSVGVVWVLGRVRLRLFFGHALEARACSAALFRDGARKKNAGDMRKTRKAAA